MAQAKTIVVPHPIAEFSPTFDISENVAPDIVGVKKGQRVQLIISYEVIEKTKSYSILRVNHLSLKPSRRMY